MGPLGWPETVFIVILALVLFGPKKLPELGRMLGKAITEFRRASTELRSTFEREMRTLEQETRSVKEAAKLQDSYNYDYSSYDTGKPYLPEPEPVSTSPRLPEMGPPFHTESASAPQGAPSIEAGHQGLTVTPAPGTIANGSLTEHHVENIAPPEPDGAHMAPDAIETRVQS